MDKTELSFRDLILLRASKSAGDHTCLLFDNSSLGTTDSLSHTDESLSLSSLRFSNFKPLSEVTLKEMVVKRHRTMQKCGEWVQRGSKKIKKDDDEAKEKTITSASFAKRQHTQKWNDEETRKFFKGLEFFGTDFSMIAKLFGSRNRLQIKNKFRKEEKINLSLVEKSLKSHNSNRFTSLLNKIRKNSCTSVDSLDRRIIGEIEDYTREDKEI